MYSTLLARRNMTCRDSWILVDNLISFFAQVETTELHRHRHVYTPLHSQPERQSPQYQVEYRISILRVEILEFMMFSRGKIMKMKCICKIWANVIKDKGEI